MSSDQDVFEVDRVLEDKRSNGETEYLVSWKNTVAKGKEDLRFFLKNYGQEVRNVWAVGNAFTIVWHNSWLPACDVQETCDEILGAYLLLKLVNHPSV